jgi:hypothetical protein
MILPANELQLVAAENAAFISALLTRISVNAVPLKAFVLASVGTAAGSVKSVRSSIFKFAQSLNADAPTLVTLCGKATYVKPSQVVKAELPIVFNPTGMITSVRLCIVDKPILCISVKEGGKIKTDNEYVACSAAVPIESTTFGSIRHRKL